MQFKLNNILEQDSHFITKLKLCEIRLIDNVDYPWLILVPQLDNIVEITDLNDQEYQLLGEETRLIAKALQKLFSPDKLNIATIGNVVSQMHMHIIVRYKKDKLFPKPVWGCEFTRYLPEELNIMIKKLLSYLD